MLELVFSSCFSAFVIPVWQLGQDIRLGSYQGCTPLALAAVIAHATADFINGFCTAATSDLVCCSVPCLPTWALLQHKLVQAVEAGAVEHHSVCMAVLQLPSALMCAHAHVYVCPCKHTTMRVGLLLGRQVSRVSSAELFACVSPGLFLEAATPGRLSDGMLGMSTCFYVCWGELGRAGGQVWCRSTCTP